MHVDNWIHDLRDPRSHIWDQGNRPTCLAIAASTAHQLTRAHPEPFAPDALWLYTLNAGAASHDGTTAAAIGDALQDWGQPVAADWPYELPFTSVVPPDSAGTPPWLSSMSVWIASTTSRDTHRGFRESVATRPYFASSRRAVR